MSSIKSDADEVPGSYIYHPSLYSTYPSHDPRTARQNTHPSHTYQTPPSAYTSLPYTPPQYPQYLPPFPNSLPPNQMPQIGYSPHPMHSLPPPVYLPAPEDMVYSQKEDFGSLIEEIITELEKDPKVVGELKFILSELVPREELSHLNDVGSILNKMKERQLLSENNVGYLENYLNISHKLLSKRLVPFRQFSDCVTKPLPAPTGAQEFRHIEEQPCPQKTQSIPRVPNDSVLDCYSMHKRPHGVCAIFNNSNFNTESLGNRKGSEIDRERLSSLFTYLQYKVEVYNDLTTDSIYKKLGEISNRDHNNFDSFVCCLLTHGADNDALYGSDGQELRLRNVRTLFYGKNAVTLFGKPKIFFIQACRGDLEDKGFTSGTIEADSLDNDIHFDTSSLPDTADFLFAYPTSSGFVSWRSHNEGTWYIKALCDLLAEHHNEHDLMSILTKVNATVAERRTSEGFKQMPAPVSHLRKQVFIRT